MTIQTYTTLADCVALAEFAHRNQTDKAMLPYIEHPRRVLAAVQAQGALPYVQMAAILHDVTEDTSFTPNMLLELGVPSSAVELIKLLDRDHSRSIFYNLFIDSCEGWHNDGSLEDRISAFYYSEIKKRPEAKMIKLEDIADNLQPWRLAYLPEKDQERLRDRKYKRALELLNS